MIRKCLTAGTILFTAIACVTTQPNKGFEKSKVIERMGDAEKTPEWATGSIAMTEEGGDAVFISQMTMGADARTEACFKAAELDGRSAMLRYIKENITSSGQINETDASSDPSYESLTAFLSQSKISGIRTTQRFWEKVETSGENADRVLKLRCSAKLAIKKSELARQLKEATTNAKGGNPQIREALLNAQQEFLSGLGGGTSENKDETPAR